MPRAISVGVVTEPVPVSKLFDGGDFVPYLPKPRPAGAGAAAATQLSAWEISRYAKVAENRSRAEAEGHIGAFGF